MAIPREDKARQLQTKGCGMPNDSELSRLNSPDSTGRLFGDHRWQGRTAKLSGIGIDTIYPRGRQSNLNLLNHHLACD
jgi:hypothetical protein